MACTTVARMLAQQLNIKAIGISSLEILSKILGGNDLVALDARKNKGLTLDEAKKLILNPHYFATMLVKCGYADGMVGGAEVSTKDNLKPALQLLKNEDSFVNSYTLIVGKNG